jgi:hypothetical protein
MCPVHDDRDDRHHDDRRDHDHDRSDYDRNDDDGHDDDGSDPHPHAAHEHRPAEDLGHRGAWLDPLGLDRHLVGRPLELRIPVESVRFQRGVLRADHRNRHRRLHRRRS